MRLRADFPNSTFFAQFSQALAKSGNRGTVPGLRSAWGGASGNLRRLRNPGAWAPRFRLVEQQFRRV